jgi:hypothetical protein
MLVDAGRYTSPSHTDIDPHREPPNQQPTSAYQDKDGVVPTFGESALPFLALGQTKTPPPPDQQINHQQVDLAVRNARADLPTGGSGLADALRNPNLNQAERNLVIQKLARDGQDGELAFYGNDISRQHDPDKTALTEDQRIIADGVQQAYASGAIDAKDLQRIADASKAPNGAQRFMSIMQLGADAKESGSATQALADALWTRNGADGKDRAAAAIYYTSDPALMASKLDTPDARAAAFEAIVDFNHSKPYEHMPEGVSVTNWQNQTTMAAGRLFISHGQELIDRYTGVTETRGAEAEVLAKFLSQTALNPEAKGMVLDRQRDLIPTINSVLGSAADTYLNRAKEAPKDSAEQTRALQQLGRLSAGISGGTSLALTEYSKQVQSDREAVKEVADMVGGTVGALTGRLDTPFGNPAEELASAITEKIMTSIQDKRVRPDAAFSSALHDEFSTRIVALENDLHQSDLLAKFEAARGAEGHEVNENLNINPGGHEE